MTTAVEGFVAKIYANERMGKKGPFMSYNVTLDGDPTSYGFGFEQPPFTEGQYITFMSEPAKNPKYTQYVKGSGKVVAKPPKEREKVTRAPAAASKVKESELFGEIGGYYSEADVTRLTWGVARDHAIRVVNLLIERKALPVASGTAAAHTAKREEELLAYIDKLAVRFFHDSASGRVLEGVEDEGSVEATDVDELPDGEALAEAAFGDGEVPPDPDEEGF